jgi:hypothetical protein
MGRSFGRLPFLFSSQTESVGLNLRAGAYAEKENIECGFKPYLLNHQSPK